MKDECAHETLVLLRPETEARLRCRHCHLTLREAELEGGSCPECREVHGVRRADFERVEITTRGRTEFRCDDCGLRLPAL